MLKRLLLAFAFLTTTGDVAQAQSTTPEQAATLVWQHDVSEVAPLSLMGEALLRAPATKPTMVASLESEGARPATLPETLLYISENAARLRGAHVVALGSSAQVGATRAVAGLFPNERGAQVILESEGGMWPIGTIVIIVRLEPEPTSLPTT